MNIKGKAHVYDRDHINTDEIIPARYLNTDKEEELAKYAMEDLDAEFVKKVKRNPTALVRCVNVSDYIQLIEEIYNFKRRTKVNLRY